MRTPSTSVVFHAAIGLLGLVAGVYGNAVAAAETLQVMSETTINLDTEGSVGLLLPGTECRYIGLLLHSASSASTTISVRKKLCAIVETEGESEEEEVDPLAGQVQDVAFSLQLPDTSFPVPAGTMLSIVSH